MTKIQENTLADETFKDAALGAVDRTFTEHDDTVISGPTETDWQMLEANGVVRNNPEVTGVEVPVDTETVKLTGAAILNAVERRGGGIIEETSLDSSGGTSTAGMEVYKGVKSVDAGQPSSTKTPFDAVSGDSIYH